MIGDLLLSWMSATGAGPLGELRRRVQWMARTTDSDDSSKAAGRWIRDMSVLGHCEVDWRGGRWAIAPAAFSALPNADGRAVLLGSRRPGMLARLDESALWIERVAYPPSADDLPMPTTILASYDSHESIAEEATRMGAVFVGCAAMRLAARAPEVRIGAPAAPPARANATLERFESLDHPYFRPAPSPAGTPSDGLYRMELLGRSAYLLARGGSWHHCSRADGVYLELERRGESVLRFRPDKGGYLEAGSLFVDWGAPLPTLHARALALCTGKVPRFGQVGQTTIYDNVPIKVAQLVAASLKQQLVFLPAAERVKG